MLIMLIGFGAEVQKLQNVSSDEDFLPGVQIKFWTNMVVVA